MSHDWAPPANEQPIQQSVLGQPVDPYRGSFDTAADELAPVDRQADPAQWLRGKALIITAAVVGIALLATIVICLIIWLTPPMHHLQVPSIPRG